MATESRDPEPDDVPPDPEPERTPGLEPGGGVPPGETPPESAQVSGTAHREPDQPRSMPVVAIVVIAVLVLMVAGFFVAYLANLLS
ncbi:hypothetical protein SAMN05421810_11196 [Amycolatopsis arida]|uniref:Uncharacterized protein n=1 Tax=Amycolatopsis arida TaxID=587909 RepID=A0A1I6A5F3_9PSEU|nr:DUF6480 family protein [Amycolatopsis arida]TDX88598.1 hypothetical protein CLV69_111117 [Amycolatopsis arida]SFQ63964.1 hypothetical protein SAMN05421810_11196 [Amycolatopsis arida]